MDGVISFTVCSFFFSLLLIIVYFGKRRIKIIENEIYSWLIVTNFIGLIIHFLCGKVAPMQNGDVFSNIVCKIYLIYLITWVLLFTLYVYIISTKKIAIACEQKGTIKEFYKRIFTIFSIIEIIGIIVVFVLPIHIFNEEGIIYTYGPSVNSVYVYSIICVVIINILMLLNFNELKQKKYLPIYAYMAISLVVVIIQSLKPELLLMTAMETFVSFLIYFTIENPDIKMLNEVQLAKIQAEQANAAKTDFLSSMSHEIRTPLNAIVGFSSVIENAENLEEAKENAKDILEASNTLLEIVNGILDISKIEAGKLELIYKDYDTKDVFDLSAKIISVKMKEKGLDFQVNIAKDIPRILLGDAGNLKKILMNLLSNAYKYTDTGVVRYTVNCVTNKETCRLMISVEDTGRGIKKESIEKLFTKFQRLDEDKNTTIEGTGLGLAITKQLVEMMGGKIVCQSVYGSGTKFTVAIDQKIISVEDNSVVKAKSIDESKIDLSNKKILVVDDNKLNLKVAERLLRQFNPQLTLVESGFEALDTIKRNEKFDLILMDDMMPKLSGTETLNELKKIPNFAIPVIALTANAITGMREQYMEKGFDDYLAKPLEKEEVIRVFETFLMEGKTKTNPILKPVVEQQEEKVEQIKIEEPKEEISTPVVESTTEVDNTVYDLDYLRKNNVDVDRGLELLGDEEMYHDTMLDFYDGLKEKVMNLNKFLREDDMPNYAIAVHALKSDAKYVGLMNVADIAYEHEMKSKANDAEYVKSNFDKLINEIKKSVVIIKKYLGK